MKNILFFSCLMFILISCKKDPAPAEHSKQVIVPCSDSANWTGESLDRALQGSWLLYRLESMKGQQSVPYLSLMFDNGHLLVFDAPHSGARHSLYTVEQGAGMLVINADSSVADVVNGNLYLCGEYLICSGIAYDGLDRYYKRD